ncbi:MAG: hypothetical protein O3B08_09800 [Proteobacteria bacterium]|nr:hypothetical protein [Pseudomonadota bacterium]
MTLTRTDSQGDTEIPAGTAQSVALWAIAAGILIALMSPFAAHLPWSVGVWPKVEPTIILLHSGAFLCAMGLGTATVYMRLHALAAIRHPIVLIALAIAAWSIAVSPVARYPLLSITGSPQIADGAVLWLDIAVFVAGVRFVLQVLP